MTDILTRDQQIETPRTLRAAEATPRSRLGVRTDPQFPPPALRKWPASVRLVLPLAGSGLLWSLILWLGHLLIG